jgi:glycosyltransferase involved in cell wall biosynthesis
MQDGLKILGWASDHNGCGNYRMGLPMWALARAGHDATAFSVLNTDVDTDVDVLVGQLICDPARSEVWRALVERPGRSYATVFEIDDDVWNLSQTHPDMTYYTGPIAKMVEDNIAMADAVTVTNSHLAEVVSKFNPNVYVLPNCFDGSVLDHQRPRRSELTVGWAGGSSHVSDFRFVQNDLKTFFRRNPDVQTHFMGTNFGAAIGRPDTRFTPWFANIVDYIESVDFDIGIAPLAFHSFNRSKSDLKFLEYASLGIPVVATDFGPYSDSIVSGLTGMLVRHPHEWSKHLRALVSDDAMREEIGANARAWASTRSIQTNYWRWEETYRAICGKRLAEQIDGIVAA